MSLSRRVHVLLDEERHAQLSRRARERGSSVGALIRDAIDQSLSDERRGARAAAGASFLSAPDMPLPDWPALEQEIEQAAADDTDPALA